MSRTVDNNGIGELYATFQIIEHTGHGYELKPDNVGYAVSLNHIGQVGVGEMGDVPIGRLEHANFPPSTVQIKGIVRFDCTEIGGSEGICVNDSVDISAMAHPPEHHLIRGGGWVKRSEDYNGTRVIAINEDDGTCDVVL